MPELEERIIAFVSKETGIKPSAIHASSRLLQDLGIDGDDAGELFEKFGTQFGVDLSPLEPHWSKHFGPEAGGPSIGFLFLTGASIILGDLLSRVFPLMPGWGWTLVLILAFALGYNKYFAKERDGFVPVTIGDLVVAATEGKWLKH
ncbi:MAG: DUF1493 family protein [Bryobacteraceae bacterium]